MVLLYDATGTYSASWARSAPAGSEATAVSDAATFDDVLARAHGVVALVRGEKEDRQIIERLKALRAAYPLRFLVVVHPHCAGAVPPLGADAVLCAANAGGTLWATVRAVEARGLAPRLADVVRSSEVVPPFLRLALLHALLRPTPISSIKELAAEVGCDRRTLPRMWELAFNSNEPGGIRLIDFLDWIVLLYATGRKTSKRSWLLVSKDVGLTEDTLMRITRRLMSVSLSELTAFGQPAVLEQFRALFERLFGHWPEEFPPGTTPTRPPCRVLVVDDHHAVGQFLDHTLRHAGFDVSTAQNGNEALLRLERGALPPSVVLADIRMPGMDGIDLAKRIATRWPAVRIVLMSAFISVDVTQLGWLREDIGCSIQFLSKPFTAGRVIALMREMCENIAQLPGA